MVIIEKQWILKIEKINQLLDRLTLAIRCVGDHILPHLCYIIFKGYLWFLDQTNKQHKQI